MRNITVGICVSAILAGCGGGGGSETPSTSATVQSVKLPNITFSVSRTEINLTQSSTLNWNVTDANSCTGSNAWSGSVSLSGSKIVNYTEGTQTFELSCTGQGGTTTKTVAVTGKQPALSFAGAWYPVTVDSLKNGYTGTIVGSFYNQIKIGSQQRTGIIVTGWGYKGWDSTSKETAKVNVALFEPDDNGLLNISTNKYISDPTTFGGASVIVSDINNDNYQDVVLVSHNETPILPNPTTVFFGSNTGTFTKKYTADKLAAHDASLVKVNNKSRILTSVVNGNPRSAYYDFVNGDINPVYTPNISYYHNHFFQIGNMSQTIVETKNGNKALITAGGCRVQLNPCNDHAINIFAFDGYDISQLTPVQSITPYLSTIPRFSTVSTADGIGQTHVYRVWSDDLNNDGNTDIIAGQSMWSEASKSFPAGLQILINQGNNSFADKTEVLNETMPLEQDPLDFTPSFIDIDNSGIKTLFFGNFALNDTAKQSNYVLLNDGTGHLHVALHDEFSAITNNIYSLLLGKGYKFIISNPSKTWQIPKFIAVPQTNGSINFLAEVINTVDINPNTGVTQVSHLFVNVPFNYNPATDFTKNINITDRNNSTKIRTWAGDDTFTDKNAVLGTRIDGGLGKNKITYSNPSTNYTVIKNSDGSYRVTSNANNIDDTLVRIHNIVFTDKTITLE